MFLELSGCWVMTLHVMKVWHLLVEDGGVVCAVNEVLERGYDHENEQNLLGAHNTLVYEMIPQILSDLKDDTVD